MFLHFLLELLEVWQAKNQYTMRIVKAIPKYIADHAKDLFQNHSYRARNRSIITTKIMIPSQTASLVDLIIIKSPLSGMKRLTPPLIKSCICIKMEEAKCLKVLSLLPTTSWVFTTLEAIALVSFLMLV